VYGRATIFRKAQDYQAFHAMAFDQSRTALSQYYGAAEQVSLFHSLFTFDNRER
jgi:hypothetical protein